MPVKHGPKGPPLPSRLADDRCIEPRCENKALPGRLMCMDHEPTDVRPYEPKKS